MARILITPMVPEDRNYILDSFLRSYGQSLYAAGTHPDVLIKLMDPLLFLWNAIVATDEQRKFILGWLVHGTGNTLAWAYTRKAFRGKGVMRGLSDFAGIQRGELCMAFMPTTSSSFDVQRAWKSGYRLRFKPYLPLQETSSVQREIAAPVDFRLK